MDVKTSLPFEERSAAPEPAKPSTAPTPSSSQSVEALKDIAFGSLAGSVGKVVEYPFDTVKVRLQSQPDHLPLRYTGPLDCFRQSLHQDGLAGLYRGVSAPLIGAAAETACLFFSYRVAQDVLVSTSLVKAKKSLNAAGKEEEKQLPLPALVVAGAMSGGVTSIILTPIELVKCRMQVPLTSPQDPSLAPRTAGLSSASLSPMAVIADVYRREGIAGFWRGQLGTLIREMGGSSAWFGTYETLSLYLKKRQVAQQQGTGLGREQNGDNVSGVSLPLYQQMLAGAAAGMNYNFLFFPADTIKSKIQTGDLAIAAREQTFWSVGRTLWRTHGLRGLYRGCGITVARSAPSSALIFTIYESLRKAFG